MFSALDSNNNLIDIDTAIQHTLNKYFCPSCHEELIIRDGSVRIKHFAHKNICDCDDNDNDMSEWHRNWQNKFPLRNREVVMKLDSDDPFAERYKKLIRRTDALCYGHAIEFQNSPISSEDFDERNYFYNRLGKKVIWIFNMIEQYNSGKIDYYAELQNRKVNGGAYKWNYASKTFVNFKSYDKDVILFFQFTEERNDEEDSKQGYLERVIWAINSNNDEEHTNFKHFYTSYYPSNFTELMTTLKKKFIKSNKIGN